MEIHILFARWCHMACGQTFLVNRIRGQIIVRKGRHDKGSNHNRNKCCGNTNTKQCWIANTERFKESAHSNNRCGYRACGNTNLAGYNGNRKWYGRLDVLALCNLYNYRNHRKCRMTCTSQDCQEIRNCRS